MEENQELKEVLETLSDQTHKEKCLEVLRRFKEKIRAEIAEELTEKIFTKNSPENIRLMGRINDDIMNEAKRRVIDEAIFMIDKSWCLTTKKEDVIQILKELSRREKED